MTRIVSMPLYLALLLSLTLHTSLVLAPDLPTLTPRPVPPVHIEARLQTRPEPEAMADSLSTRPVAEDALPQPRAAPPSQLRGNSLRRAQSALSEHLYYPPQAVAMGMEGEVILLLTLSERGQLLSASVARSSGHTLLDQAALDAAQRLGALPGSPRQTLFPVRFSLQ